MEMNNNLNVKPKQKQEPLFLIPAIAMGIYFLCIVINNTVAVAFNLFFISTLLGHIAHLAIIVSCVLFFLNNKFAKTGIYIATGMLFVRLIVYPLACLIDFGVPSLVSGAILSLITLIPYIFLSLSVKNNGKKFFIPIVVFEVIAIVLGVFSFISILITYLNRGYVLLSTVISDFKSLVSIVVESVGLVSLPIALRVTYDKANPKPAFVPPVQPVPQYRPVQPYQPAPPYQQAPQYRPVQPVQPMQPNMQNNPNFAYLNAQPMQQAPVQQVPVYAAPAQPVQPVAPQPVAPQPVAPQPVQPEQTSLEKELHAIKLLLDQGILSAEEYESKQKEILEKHKF